MPHSPESPQPTLKEFVESVKPSRRCSICNLPTEIREQVDQALRDDVTNKVINDWLKTIGQRVPDVSSHKGRGHHKETE